MSSGSSYSLDAYGTPVVWYEMVKRFNAYSGACIRVRRSSDNAEQDINFVNDLLDTTSLLSFVGAGNGFVTTFYTQVGTKNVTNATATQQPQIVSSGALITRNGFVSIKYDGSNDNLFNWSAAFLNISNVSYFSVSQCDSSGVAGAVHNQSNSTNITVRTFVDRNVNNVSYAISAVVIGNPPQKNDSNLRLLSNYSNSASFMSTFQNSVAGNTATGVGGSNEGLQLGQQFNASWLNGAINCFGAYNTDNSANRVAIETILNNYYTIY
jgi:hypothetical protein